MGYPQPCTICHAVGCDCSLRADILGHRTDSFGKCLWPEKCQLCGPAPALTTTPGPVRYIVMGANGEDVGSDPFGPTGATDSATASQHAAWYRGYKQSVEDVLTEIVRNGKQNLVQWLEKRLESMP